MDKKGIVIIGAGLMQKPLIETAKKRGWHVIAADLNSQAPGVSLADVFLPVSTRDTGRLIRELQIHEGKFHHCATLGTDMTASVAAVNHAFGLGGLSVRQAEVTTHKGKMREFLSANGLKQPAFIITGDKSVALDWAHKNDSGKGFVIKPAHNMGARGVMFISKPHELGFAFEYARSKASGDLAAGDIILEQFIEAHELSVDALCVQGRTYITGLADRCIDIRQGRYFIETGHTMPAQKGSLTHDAISQELDKISRALGELDGGVYSGALKGDIRLVRDNSVVVGEVATRLSGGFMSTHTYPMASGNDLLNGYLDVLENKVPEMCINGTHDSYNNVTIERAILSKPGIVKNIVLPDLITKECDNDEAKVREVFIHCKTGDYIGSLQSNVGKPGNIVVTASSLAEAEACATRFMKLTRLDVDLQTFSRKEINEHARINFNKEYCHVCKVCDGVNCASGVPGMGGLGEMKAFHDNLVALAELQVKYPDNVSDSRTPDLSSVFLNQKIPFPILNGPITGSITNMGESITEYDHAIEIAMGMKELGLPALFGDGAGPDKYHTSIEAIRQSGGGFLVVKPRRDNREIIQRIIDAENAGANGWGIDIDAVNLITMKNKSQIMAKKSTRDLLEISKESSLPFFIKGIMDIDTALEMAESGASALIVSNHGGRVDDNMPGSARVLNGIVIDVKKRFSEMQIYADGGIRCGEDTFKMIALGADGVLVGRPVTIAAVACARLGVFSVLKTYADELTDVMKQLGLAKLTDIETRHILHKG